MPGSRQRCLCPKAPQKNPSAADVQAAGGRAAAIEADVTDADEVDRLAAEVTAALGPADVLILNAAGISQPAGCGHPDRCLLRRGRRFGMGWFV